MEQYKSNVVAIMEFLKSEGFSASTISLHKRCYQELEEFLITTNHLYSCYTASQWIKRSQSSWDYRKYTGYKHCIRQLEDVWYDGRISPDHLCFRTPPYDLLASGFKGILDSFLRDCDYGADDRYRISCARFLLYLQGKGVGPIKSLDYELLLKFHEEDYHVSPKPKDAHPLAWDDVLRFLSGMEDARYGNTVLKSSKHILALLYIFLDMHRTGINETLIWHWFHKVKPLLGTNWKQHRRPICQFLIFLDTEMITTESSRDSLLHPGKPAKAGKDRAVPDDGQ